MHYLTNFLPEEAPRYRAAINASGMSLDILPHPMPPFHDDDDFWFVNHYDYEGAKRSGLYCLVGYEANRDYSDFWRAYDQEV